ncbi:MAG: MBL fold metallo-hydrolase [Magnetococcales bacterium]|nr:MBL fold metallo-hydrolase [Magnetococcales bacterium]
MKMTFLGVGGAFTTLEYGQSNMLLTAKNGKGLLIDCGADARLSLADQGIGNQEVANRINGVYISHLHADHVGGLEWLAFNTYFNPRCQKPKLYAEKDLLYDLWHHSLKGGLEFVHDQVMELEDYFECHPLTVGKPFYWEEIRLTPYDLAHIQIHERLIPSYGLTVEEDWSFFLSTDALYHPPLRPLLEEMAGRMDLLFQDCDTSAFKTPVHAHYDELRTLPKAIRKKMWLYHYAPTPPYDAVADGFQGFVTKGQTFG